jgi:hypothetical protein
VSAFKASISASLPLPQRPEIFLIIITLAFFFLPAFLFPCLFLNLYIVLLCLGTLGFFFKVNIIIIFIIIPFIVLYLPAFFLPIILLIRVLLLKLLDRMLLTQVMKLLKFN